VILNGNLVYCGEVCRKVGAARAIRPRNQKQPEDVKPRSNGCGLSWERIQDNINRIVEREQERIRQAARLAREKSS
jgi:hypothetical protein